MSSTSSYSRRSRSHDDETESLHSIVDLIELFDVSARLEGSVEMERLRLSMLSDCDNTYKRVFHTIGVAKALGGYLPFRYYLNDNQEGYGRMKCEVLVEGLVVIPYVHMKREIRAHLANKYYWDVDIVNCLPSLFKQLLDSADIPCPMLEKYVLHREECMDEIMKMSGVTRDQAKNLLIRLIYFGSIDSWKAEIGILRDSEFNLPNWVVALKHEVKHTAQCLLSRPEHDSLKRYYMRRSAVDTLGPGEGAGSMLALLLQTKECQCIRALVDAIKTDERTVGSIIYDGVHVEKLPAEQTIARSALERRYEFYKMLINQDISGRDWINDRPLTESFSDMVSQNLAYEHHFVKAMVLSSPPESVINIQLEDLFERFKDWLDVNVSSTSLRDRHNTTTIKFGQKMTKLVATTTNTEFEGILKKRTKYGIRYIIDVDIVRREMMSKHWISEGDACMD
eukprot:gene9254-16403_t